MSRESSAEDLLVRARRCELAEDEERRFEIAVGSSRELELLFDAGVHFDEQARVLPGDETRFTRLVERTLAELDQASGSKSEPFGHATRSNTAARRTMAARYFGASLAFGLLLSVALASAWDYVEQHRSLERAATRAQQSPPRAVASSVAPRSTQQLALPAASAPVLEVVRSSPISEQGNAAPPASATRSAPVISASALEPPSALTSSELFARANQARREGDIEAAIALYERLGREYPASAEAGDAKVLVGNLLLGQRSPRAALRQFEDYGEGASGALTLEALWGRAQALRKLGSPDERTILVALVRDYPGSAYSEAAKKRLAELTR